MNKALIIGLVAAFIIGIIFGSGFERSVEEAEAVVAAPVEPTVEVRTETVTETVVKEVHTLTAECKILIDSSTSMGEHAGSILSTNRQVMAVMASAQKSIAIEDFLELTKLQAKLRDVNDDTVGSYNKLGQLEAVREDQVASCLKSIEG